MTRTSLIPLLALVLVAFAGNSLLTRAALDGGLISAGVFSGIRIGSGALVLALIAAARRQTFWPWRGDLPGILSLFGYVAGFSFAYLSLGAGLGALILFGFVQITTISAGLLARERLSAFSILGLIIAALGLLYLLRPMPGAAPLLPSLLMAAAGVSWGLYTLLGRGAPDPTLRTTRNFLGAVPLAALLWFAGPPGALTTAGVVLAILSGTVSSALGYALWYRVLPRLRALTAGTTQLLVPPATALLAAPLLHEPITAELIIATLIILGGVALTFKKAR